MELRGLLVALVAVPLMATPAAASTVSVEGGVLLVAAAPGETNQVSVSQRVPPGSDAPSEYGVRDDSASATAGAGCTQESSPLGGGSIVCAAAGVQSVVIRLGDGDDGATEDVSRIPTTAYGEAGNDRIALLNTPGTLADGGEGNDDLQNGDDLRGGSGDDQITGQRLLDGGDGNDRLRKTGGTAPGRLAGGPGDDTLDSGDGLADELQCGEGRDVITSADPTDRNDGSCESGTGIKAPPPRAKPYVTVFELPKGRSRPGRNGRLKVWMRCSVPNCKVTVRIFFVGDRGTKGYARFRKPPAVRLVVGATAKLVSVRLNRAQRRGLRRSKAYSGVGATVITRRPGPDHRMQTDGLFCRRADPCTDARARGRG